jgi:hypothetical protein
MFLGARVAGEHDTAFLTSALVRRAVEFDDRYRDLDLGLADGSVTALAERYAAPILTFDFEHFRATRPRRGYWRLVIDEASYDEAVNARSAPLWAGSPSPIVPSSTNGAPWPRTSTRSARSHRSASCRR